MIQILTFNKLAIELSGYSPTELPGTDLRTLWNKDETSCQEDESCDSSTSNRSAVETNSGRMVFILNDIFWNSAWQSSLVREPLLMQVSLCDPLLDMTKRTKNNSMRKESMCTHAVYY